MKIEFASSNNKELTTNKMDSRKTLRSSEIRKRRYQEESKVAVQKLARSSRNGASSTHHQTTKTGKSQLSSFLLFASLIILINLCPFQSDFYSDDVASRTTITRQAGPLSSSVWPTSGNNDKELQLTSSSYLTYLQTSLEFVKLVFRQPLRLNKRVTRCSQAEARVLGKMAKVWYIKKKIKKLSKKLKKHTIAVPVFTAIPIYEHSYYPQPHVTHISHGGGMHHAAASSYTPSTVSAAGPSATLATAPLQAASSQQMVAAASSPHQHAAYVRTAPGPHRGAMYHPQAGSHHIINAYVPSPPLFVDDTGGLYGHYGNAYGRYDGGYHAW